MSELKILEHTSSSYGPRTYANAVKGDVTIAIAVDYTTAGEKLTHKAAGEKYLKLDPQYNEIDNARKLYARLKSLSNRMPIINVAGNGIYTLHKHKETQERINAYVFILLAKVHEHWPIGEIVSGGQTGVDLAGGVVGFTLDIPTTLLLPKGFKQRFEDGKDVDRTEDDVRQQVIKGSEELLKDSYE